MSTTTNTADSGTVADEKRGDAIRARRIAQGWNQRQFAARARESREAKGISREAVIAAESGRASANTYQRLEAFLDSWEHEVSEDLPGLPTVKVFEFELEGEAGRFIGRVSTDDPEEIERIVRAVARGLDKPTTDEPLV